jgi:WD40 repeat protein
MCTCVSLSEEQQPSCCMFTVAQVRSIAGLPFWLLCWKEVTCWSKGAYTSVFVQPKQTICCMAASADATFVAAGTSNTGILLYNLAAMPHASHDAGDIPGKYAVPLESGDAQTCMYGHSGPVAGLSFSYDRRIAYSCGVDGTVRMWMTTKGINLVIWRGHLVPVWDVQACPQGHWIASAGADWTVKLWCGRPGRSRSCFLVSRSSVLACA